MAIYFKKFIFILFVIILFTTCKKYPEGPSFSVLSARQRLIRSWELENVIVNGIDSTFFFESNKKIRFINDKKNWICFFNGDNITGKWELRSGNETLDIGRIYNTGPTQSINIFRYESIQFKIQRLTTKELWLRGTRYGFLYYYKFKKV